MRDKMTTVVVEIDKKLPLFVKIAMSELAYALKALLQAQAPKDIASTSYTLIITADKNSIKFGRWELQLIEQNEADKNA